MGAGASAENARTTVAHMLTGKPADASDIKVNYFYNHLKLGDYKGPFDIGLGTSAC